MLLILRVGHQVGHMACRVKCVTEALGRDEKSVAVMRSLRGEA